jgi:hypothetical protein
MNSHSLVDEHMLPHNKDTGSSPVSYKNYKELLEREIGSGYRAGWVGY